MRTHRCKEKPESVSIRFYEPGDAEYDRGEKHVLFQRRGWYLAKRDFNYDWFGYYLNEFDCFHPITFCPYCGEEL